MQVLIFFGILLLFFFLLGNRREGMPQYSTDFVTVGERPPIGDYLPTTGNVPTGMGNYEEESVPDRLSSILCEECVSHCINWATIHGISTDLPHDTVKCHRYCKVECDPTVGF